MFFFNDTATTEIYTLSLHDALPICAREVTYASGVAELIGAALVLLPAASRFTRFYLLALLAAVDRKSTRLNSSHANISYAVFCLKKKQTNNSPYRTLNELNHDTSCS